MLTAHTDPHNYDCENPAADSLDGTGNNVTPKPLALICDDEEMILELMDHHLCNAGFDVMRASDGSEALSLLRERTPDIVILDVMMPIVDGNQVLHHIRNSEDLPAIPVIMLTVRETESDVVTAFKGGVSDYVAKPFMVGDLLERAKRLVAPTFPALAV